MNLTLKIMWKLIINKKKEYLALQVNALLQNTRTKEKQMEKLQMSAKEQIGMEVRNVSFLIVQSIAKQHVMVLAKNIVPNLVKESVDDYFS